ncbi:hypothetical protein [Shewanella sp. MTB7]|uniref:hypothetical protein n=1 Tax=Shewanella sp. MTB7 TaxID=2746932 RepID=UPI0022BA581D|nr:hypothetical protein [Shewanella sp. MTB7]WBJ95718.1 hypothetical protein HWQ47_00845 [Shewanella sp. MTB7]
MKLVPIEVSKIKAYVAFVISCSKCGSELVILAKKRCSTNEIIDLAGKEGWYGCEALDETCLVACPSCVSVKLLAATEKEHALIKKLREAVQAPYVINSPRVGEPS